MRPGSGYNFGSTEKFFQCDKGDGRESVEILLFCPTDTIMESAKIFDVEKICRF